jgi:hypothetical protein
MHGPVCPPQSGEASLRLSERQQGRAIEYRIKRANLEHEWEKVIAGNTIEGIGKH